ncbi:MAG TPA: shikimate dehydrogenase [Rhizomicrobium sp.]|jgi:shikimate dehydrogenase|nr:shikimate dehydrogenase [Rhizomicrobium sp.]
MSISGKAKLAGLIGWPVAHSLSPRLHGHWLAAHAIDGAYIPLAVRREDFATTVAALRRAGFAGVNVTVPHKEAAFALAHTLDAAAQAAGAANLLLFGEDGRIEGRNTDAAGLASSLSEELGKNTLTGKDATVLGAGGAARAAVLALAGLGAKQIRIVNRHRARAEALGRALKDQAQISVFDWNQMPRALEGTQLLLNATSGGMDGQPALDISLNPLPLNAIVCDVVYNPLDTDLLLKARAGAHRTVDGLGMLMHQAVPAFAAFYGETPKVTPALRAELKKALRHG